MELLLKSSLAFSLNAGADLTGAWLFESMIYQGKEQPPLSPDLRLCAEYKTDGTSHLTWFREGQKGFCERWGTYRFDGKMLIEDITALNPNNAQECGKDPDMQMNRHTETPAELVNGRLHTHLSLADEPLVYIWTQQAACPPLPSVN